MEFNKLVFPAPQSSYDENLSAYLDEPGSLLYIPRIKHQPPTKKSSDEIIQTTSINLSKKKPDVQIKPDGYIPCLYLPFIDEMGQYSNVLMIYFHGNAEDIYLAYDLLKNLKKELKVLIFIEICSFYI
jgi:hypothetical protein